MTKVYFAILAHNNRPCLRDLVSNLRAFSTNSNVVLFNGGVDTDLAADLDVEVCPYSEPLRWANLPVFHHGIMRWLYEEARSYDFLVTLDSDMLIIKPGFEDYLDTKMSDSAYMAVDFRELPLDPSFLNGQRYHLKWKGVWQPIFGTRNPYGCFNPGQVFRREYVDRLMQFPGREEMIVRMRRSRIPHLEEMIYPTLAVTLKCNPRRNPFEGPSDAWPIRNRKRHSLAELEAYLRNPDVFFIHPVAMDVDAPERELVHAFETRDSVDFERFRRLFEVYRSPVPLRQRARAFLTPVIWRAKNVYLRFLAE